MGEGESETTSDARIAEIRAKLERGEEVTPEEQAVLQSEGLDLPAQEGTGPPAV